MPTRIWLILRNWCVLIFPTKALQMQFAFDALKRLAAPVEMRYCQVIVGGEQPAGSLKGDGSNRAVGQAMRLFIHSLEEQIAVENDPIDPLVASGQKAIPRGNLVENLAQPGRELKRLGRVAVPLKKGGKLRGRDHPRLEVIKRLNQGTRSRKDKRGECCPCDRSIAERRRVFPGAPWRVSLLSCVVASRPC